MQKTNARRLFPALAACLLLCAGLFGCSAQTDDGSNPVVSSAGSTKPCASAPQGTGRAILICSARPGRVENRPSVRGRFGVRSFVRPRLRAVQPVSAANV